MVRLQSQLVVHSKYMIGFVECKQSHFRAFHATSMREKVRHHQGGLVQCSHKEIAGTAHSLRKWGPWFNGTKLLFLSFAWLDFNFPQVGHVGANHMNYYSAAYGMVGMIAMTT